MGKTLNFQDAYDILSEMKLRGVTEQKYRPTLENFYKLDISVMTLFEKRCHYA